MLLRHLNPSFTIGLCAPDLTPFFLFSHIDFRLVDSRRCRFLTNAIDIARLVRDIGDVDVDQRQTNFVQF